MRVKPKDKQALARASLKEVIEIYGKEGSLKHLTCANLKDIHYRISLQSDLIREPFKENKSGYLCELERYFKLVSQVRSQQQLSLF